MVQQIGQRHHFRTSNAHAVITYDGIHFCHGEESEAAERKTALFRFEPLESPARYLRLLVRQLCGRNEQFEEPFCLAGRTQADQRQLFDRLITGAWLAPLLTVSEAPSRINELLSHLLGCNDRFGVWRYHAIDVFCAQAVVCIFSEEMVASCEAADDDHVASAALGQGQGHLIHHGPGVDQ
ncbi:hypothetical protein A9977_12105 [Variovorax sp. UMC13]|nr:hypothetical protein [Variovorax sp. UMC13]